MLPAGASVLAGAPQIVPAPGDLAGADRSPGAVDADGSGMSIAWSIAVGSPTGIDHAITRDCRGVLQTNPTAGRSAAQDPMRVGRSVGDQPDGL